MSCDWADYTFGYQGWLTKRVCQVWFGTGLHLVTIQMIHIATVIHLGKMTNGPL